MTHIQPTTATHDKYGFPLQACTRCGGSGRHSYCERFGTTCFGCGGKGRTRTRAADREYRAWGEAVIAVQTTPIADVKVGELLWTSVAMNDPKRWWTVAAIEVDAAGMIVNGQPVPTVTFTVTRRGQTHTLTHCGADATVRINRGDAQPKPDEYVARAIKKEESKK